MQIPSFPITAIIPAAGIGSRMQASLPKQYLTLQGKTILEHTVEKLLGFQPVQKVIVATHPQDKYFADLSLASHPNVIRVNGGDERADSVFNALRQVLTDEQSIDKQDVWVMVHDAARPNISHADMHSLYQQAIVHPVGGILAAPVRDTMKRSNLQQEITSTVEREALWHALTPQMFRAKKLYEALELAKQNNQVITDEASAMENMGLNPLIVAGRSDNLKITQPEDLALAEFYLSRSYT